MKEAVPLEMPLEKPLEMSLEMSLEMELAIDVDAAIGATSGSPGAGRGRVARIEAAPAACGGPAGRRAPERRGRRAAGRHCGADA